jgi:hypothetical protein
MLTGCLVGGMLPDMGIGEIQAPDRQGQSPSRTLGQRVAWLPSSWRRAASVALACYAVVVVFGITYGIVWAVSGRNSGGTAVVWGICVAAPLALALVWERLTGLRVFGVEVTLDQAIVRVDSTLDTALSEQQFFSDSPAILRLIDKVTGNPDIELLEVNLRTTGYWWSTRLYLQAALAQDYTNIQRLVFVDGDNDRRYVGMAAPGEVRRALAESGGLDLEFSYRLAKQAPRALEHSETQSIVYAWTTANFARNGIPGTEEQAMTVMTAELLTRLVELETDSAEWNQPLDSAHFQALVLEKGARYVPLVQNGRLARIVNADAFARNLATQALRARNR